MSEFAGPVNTTAGRPRALSLVEHPPQTRRQNLSMAPNGFIGRGPELSHIARLLSGSARLITLIGAGGIGKTRLAAEAAGEFQRRHGAVVHWVRLARLPVGADVAVIAAEVARAVLGPDELSLSAVIDALGDPSSGRRVLLVMDSCEHVLDGAGHVVAELLDMVPDLMILATSREPIVWVDEQLLTVPPLTRQQAIDLFCERAELADCPVIEPDQLAMAEQVCERVHNNPLFVRLAAARLMRQPLAVVLRELSGTDSDRRMNWTHGPRVGAEARHQRVRDVIGWSYDLCDVKERLLLERMTVFTAGVDSNPVEASGGIGADLEAVQMICADDDGQDCAATVRVDRHEIEGLLGQLADRSLVSRRISKTSVRYFLVESVRLFARDRLRERVGDGAGELARLTKRHRRYYRNLVSRARAEWGGPAERSTLEWMRPAWDNIMAALEIRDADAEERTVAVEIAAVLFPLPLALLGDAVGELRERIERVLSVGEPIPPDPAGHRIAARAMVAWLALCQGRQELAGRLLGECFAACGPVVERWRHRPEVDPGLPAPAEFVWGAELLFVHRDVRSVQVFDRARDKYRRDGDRAGAVASVLSGRLATGLLGTVEHVEGASVQESDQDVLGHGVAVADLVTASTLTRREESAQAMSLERQALKTLWSSGDRWGALWAVQSRVWSLARAVDNSIRRGERGRRELIDAGVEAARLIGGATALRARLGIDIGGLGPYADQNNRAIEILTDFLGHEAYAKAEQQGLLLCPESDELPRFALGALSMEQLPPEHPARRYIPSNWDDLTLSEEQVALLAAAGWTNTAIASRRGSSCKTVNAQMVSVFQKLNITSREEIIGFVPDGKKTQVRSEAVAKPGRATRVLGMR
ncbi:helix-turn-helix transcriptional regulator [Nocardia brasiliensis]|uniref:helix-turn-helix transcriptional regulator n=1 Tax=Nocardia brasiliensis TaxID=37326 RepID=UPI0024566C26|nr:AAA family ATPase [Nocardia brasiliensis]